MLCLQIYYPSSGSAASAVTSSAAAQGLNPKDREIKNTTVERRGIARLFRQVPPPRYYKPSPTNTASPPSAGPTLLFIVAVPDYISANGFLEFCGSHIEHVSEIIFFRNDDVKDWYSVLITLADRLAADKFYHSYNGQRFKPGEAEICHIYYIQDVKNIEYENPADIPSRPPPGFTELPTCPVCLEKLDQDTSGIEVVLCKHSIQCSCFSKGIDFSCKVCRLCQQHDEKQTCAECELSQNLLVCLICGFVGCGRFKPGHATRHFGCTGHPYLLALGTWQIWDYDWQRYVHRLTPKADGKSVLSHCTSTDGECGTSEYDKDPELALLSCKFKAIMDEGNHLIVSRLENQKQYYESLLAKAGSGKAGSISEAVQMAVIETYGKLIREQELLYNKYEELEERKMLSIKMRTERLRDLEQQMRDFQVLVGIDPQKQTKSGSQTELRN